MRCIVFVISGRWIRGVYLRQMEEEWNKAKKISHADHFRMISSIDSLNTSMFAFLGMNRESVRREQGWNIMDLGRKLEQSLYIITLLRSVFQTQTGTNR